MVMDIAGVLARLPHRYPMLLVDRVEELVEGERIAAIKAVTINEGFFQGHFPGRPIMPGALICEAMAQVGGVALQYPEENRGLIPMFTGMERVHFRSPVVPGDVLVTKAVIEKIKGRMGKVHCEGTVDGVRKADADFIFYLMDQNKSKK